MYKRNPQGGPVPWRRFLLTLVLTFIVVTTCFAADVTLRWDANTESDLAGYNVYYKENTPGPPYNGVGAFEGDSFVNIPLANLNDINNPEFILTGLPNTITYFLVITAYDDVGNESGYSNEVFTFYISPLQNGYIVNDINYQAFNVSGRGAVGTSINIYVNNTLLGTTIPVGDGSWAVDIDFTNITEGIVNLYATTNTPTTLITSKTFAGIFDITAPIPPTITQSLVVNVVSNNQVDLTWKSVPNATGYIIYRNGHEIIHVINNSYNDIGLTPSTTYEYEIATINNPSIRSNLESATTFNSENTPPGSGGSGSSGCFINTLMGR